MAPNTETVVGYAIDGGCIRKNARDNLLEKARTHSKECALMGHCVQSGYGIVTEEDRLTMLDSDATLEVVHAVEDSDLEEGIELCVTREERDEKMETMSVKEA